MPISYVTKLHKKAATGRTEKLPELSRDERPIAALKPDYVQLQNGADRTGRDTDASGGALYLLSPDSELALVSKLSPRAHDRRKLI